MAERRAVVSVAVLALVLAACRAHDERVRTLASAGSATGTPSAAIPAIDPSAREKLELMRVAESRRAPELAAVAESAAPERTTALLALAHAEDVELVLERVSLIALDRSRADRLEALQVIRDVAYRRPRDRERLAPESLAACVVNLKRLASDEREEPPLRALASAAVNAYVRGGYAVPSPTASVTTTPSAAPRSGAPASAP